MLDEILRFLARGEGPLTYLVLAVAAAVEYVFPPFPGDTVTLFGAFLAVHRGYHAAGVLVATLLGSAGGSMLAYDFGRRLKRRRDDDRLPRWLRGPRAQRALDSVGARFARHGAVYLCVNRFLPAFRAFFFVGAGLAGLRPAPVLLYGTISAALWNSLLLAAAWGLDASWPTLLDLAKRYTEVVAGLVGLLVIVWLVRWFVRRRRRGKSGFDESAAPPVERGSPKDE